MLGMGIGRRCVLAVLAGAVLAVPGVAEDRLWITYPAISPDGAQIAFTYRGQIHLVDAEAGGVAIPLTSQGYHSHRAVWSPDAGQLAFASDVNGDDDVYVTDFGASPVRRLTWSSRAEVPVGFSPGGDTVLFSRAGLGDPEASVPPPGSRMVQLYDVDLESGGERLLLPYGAREAVWNGAGTQLVYSYDPSLDPGARQLRVASNARQIWLYDSETDTHTRLLEGPVDVLNPLWSADEASIFHLSEASGRLNVWRHDLETGQSVQLTDFTDHPVRHLSVSQAGDLAFTQAGGLYRLAAGSDTPERLAIVIPEQVMDQPVRNRSLEAREFVSSPDGAFWGMIVDNQVFVADRSGQVAQVTFGEEPKRDIAFSSDGALLAYAALRDHRWAIYAVSLLDEDGDPDLRGFEETALVELDDGNAFQPGFSPDGGKLAFIAYRREVAVLDLGDGEITTLFAPEDYNSSYSDGDLWFSWSPDSRHLAASWRQVPFAVVQMAGVVPADGSGPVAPLTTAISNVESAFWSADGMQIVASTVMFGPRRLDYLPMGAGEGGVIATDLYRVFMSGEARSDFLDAAQDGGGSGEVARNYDFSAQRSSILEDRLTDQSVLNLFTAPLGDGSGLVVFLLDAAMNDVSLALLDLESGEMTEIADGEVLAAMGALDMRHLSYVPGLNVLDVQTPDGVVSIPLDFLDATRGTRLSVDTGFVPSARRAEAFEQIWADIRFTFYRSDLEGRDWDAIGETYRAFLPGVASDRELSELVTEMFGELSASHLMVGYQPDEADRHGLPTRTATLGFYTGDDREGPGVPIAAILPGGPLDRQSLEVGEEDRIVWINGMEVDDQGGLDRLLDGMEGRMVSVGILPAGQEEVREIGVRPIGLPEEGYLAYRRWVDARRAMVEALSGACIVYEHMPAMDNGSYLRVSGRFLAARGTARAALLDVRSNPGGNEHRQLLNFLTGEPFAQVGREDRDLDVEPLDRWLGPSAVLIDSFAYSDGTIFPQAYQDIGIGPVIGERLLNTGTGVNYISSRLIPGLTYGIPVMPFRQLDGTFYENLEIEPDILVPFDPNVVLSGRDAALEAAVAALMEELGPDADC